MGKRLKATDDGKITMISEDQVTVEHKHGWFSTYFHLEPRSDLGVGMEVKKGETIGMIKIPET